MNRKPGVIMRLVGDMRLRGEDWSMSEFGNLFSWLGTDIKGSGNVTRYMRYHGVAGDITELRFFGVEVDEIESIPGGMVALELGQDTITLFREEDEKPIVTWQGNLTWTWLDDSTPDHPVGEFITEVPIDWLSQAGNPQIEFIFSANSYIEQGKETDDEVRLVEYDPAWSDRFAEMADRLRKDISPGIALRIEHYGSTAIPGIPAKPVIDILLEIPSFAEARNNLIPLLNRPECEYWWYNEHMVFIIRDRPMGTRTYHIHAAPKESQVWEGLEFRDYLRSHKEVAERYAELKRQLAESHADDREEYTIRKEVFVREITEKALKSAM